MSKAALLHVYKLTGVTGSEKNVLLILAVKHDHHAGFSQMSAPQIARHSCLSDNCVRRALKSLAAKGHIDIVQTKAMKGHKYILNGLEGKSKEDLLITHMFEEFWKAYPKKRSKPASLKAFIALKPTPELTITILNDLVERMMYDWSKRDIQYVPYPSSYLNQRQWEDEIEKPDDKQAGGVVW